MGYALSASNDLCYPGTTVLINKENIRFSNLPREKYIKEIADFYHELNMLHPFREGNGRTQRTFFSLLLRRNGNDIDFANCDADFLIMATVQAAKGIIDYLEDFFRSYVQFGIGALM